MYLPFQMTTLIDPPFWRIEPIHVCGPNWHVKETVANMVECMNLCAEIVGCVAVMFKDHDNSCYPQSYCEVNLRATHSWDLRHVALFGNLYLIVFIFITRITIN